ncbi:MAG: hypothetical protein K0S32_2132 [Bacteroidetes bacterium]|jgi:hypothetical protein|nr:hypothetical protein [Bacteroidota bacterium]
MKKILILFFCALAITALPQRIQNFNVFSAGQSVGIRFTVTKGPQCNGYTIYHSLDSVNFNQIYNYPGICGDMNSNQDYTYTHTTPALNQPNFYKIDLFPIEVSEIKRIHVGENQLPSILVYPNPVVGVYDILNLKVFNVNNANLVGAIYNQFGKPVKYIDVFTQGDLATSYISEFGNGLYTVWLSDGNNVFAAKFIINR